MECAQVHRKMALLRGHEKGEALSPQTTQAQGGGAFEGGPFPFPILVMTIAKWGALCLCVPDTLIYCHRLTKLCHLSRDYSNHVLFLAVSRSGAILHCCSHAGSETFCLVNVILWEIWQIKLMCFRNELHQLMIWKTSHSKSANCSIYFQFLGMIFWFCIW